MAKISKYQPLADYLKGKNEDLITLTFSEIEQILGFNLEDSYRKHQAAWYGSDNNSTHRLPVVCAEAGYNTKDVNMKEEKVTFYKMEDFDENLESGQDWPELSKGFYIVFQRYYEEGKAKGIISAKKEGKHYHVLLAKVVPGDIIFHYHKTKLYAISVATSRAYDSNEPGRHEVKCTYHEFAKPIDLTEYRTKLNSYCCNLNKAPFNKFGTGNQGYLFHLPRKILELFIKLIKETNPDFNLSIINDRYNALPQFSFEEDDEEKVDSSTTLNNPLNQILYGPPGTGKTYTTKKYAVSICGGVLDDYLDEYKRLVDEGRVVFTTFHQSYGYEDFIEGIKPTTKNDAILYNHVDGVFKEFCKKAANKDNEKIPYVFIIDEINRGNISKIFGELITLIEDSKRKGNDDEMEVRLPSGDMFSVPNNVYILGTMNTADRSIAMMDTALRRRFDFIEMMPNSDIVANVTVAGVSIKEMLDAINKRITVLYDREHTIGHAFFKVLDSNSTINDLALIFKNKIIPLLQEYFYEDYSKIRLVLGDNGKADEKYQFVKEIDNSTKNVFKGNYDPDLVENFSYEINNDALKEPESYIQIYK